MKERLQQLASRARKAWTEASWPRRLALLGMVALVVATFATMVLLGGASDYRNLVNDAAPEEVQAIVTQLKKANIPCRVSASGTVVQVEADRLDQARMEVASSGLARGGTGFELFDRSDFGMTNFQERVNYRRALEGELSRTIRSLAEVRSARVHLVIPRRALFKDERVDPSASVVVNLRPGRSLNERQIQGVRLLVASAVEGLEAGRVTILDGHGAILARVTGDDGDQATSERLGLQHRVEHSLEQRIVSLLEPVVGLGKVVAQVTVEMDYQRVVETNESFDPDAAVVRSEQLSSEVSGKELPPAKPQGVPGSRSNLPGSPDNKTATTAAAAPLQRNSRTVNYEISKKVRQVEHGAATLKRISAAVVVDGTYSKQEKEGAEKTTYRPRSEAEMARLGELVKKAIGFDANRGDQVEVSNLPFQVPDELEPGTGWLSELDINRAVQWLVVLVVVVLLVLFGLRPLLRGNRRTESELLLPGGRPATVLEIEQAMRRQQALPSGEQSPGESEQAPTTAETEPEDEVAGGKKYVASLQQRVRRLADHHPERTIQLLRSWLREEAP